MNYKCADEKKNKLLIEVDIKINQIRVWPVLMRWIMFSWSKIYTRTVMKNH